MVILLEYQSAKTSFAESTFQIDDYNGEEIVYENDLQKTNQKEFRIETVIKKKSDKLYVKWKGYNNSFNSSIDEKRHNINE